MKGSKLLWYVVALCYAFIVLGPFMWVVRTSLAPDLDHGIVPASLTLKHFKAVLSRPEIVRYLMNSAAVSLGSVMIVLPVGLAAGYALARFRFWGQRMVPVFLALPLLPAVAILVPLTSYMRRLGLYDTLPAVILANAVFNVPFALWMLRNFIASTPVEIEEAAQIDGCSRLGTLVRIAIPVAAPGVISVMVFVFISAWNNYLYAFALTSSQDLRVLPHGVLAFLGSWGTYWGGLSVAGIVAVVPPIALFLIFQKWFVAGMFQQWSR